MNTTNKEIKEKEERLLSFKQEIEGLRNIANAEEYARQLAHLFLGNGLSLQTILLMAIDFGQQHPHWISVEDELPKEAGWYLVATPTLNSKIDVALWDGKWRRLITITHWMPMPQPPRKED